MPSKEDMLKKAKRNALRYQGEVAEEVDPKLKAHYTTTFEDYARDIERLKKKKNTWNPVKYVKNRKDKDLDLDVLNAAYGLEEQYSEYATKSEEARTEREKNDPSVPIAPSASQQQFDPSVGNTAYGYPSAWDPNYQPYRGNPQQQGLPSARSSHDSSVMDAYEADAQYYGNYSHQTSMVMPNPYAPGPSNYQNTQQTAYYANPYAQIGASTSSAIHPYYDPNYPYGHPPSRGY